MYELRRDINSSLSGVALQLVYQADNELTVLYTGKLGIQQLRVTRPQNLLIVQATLSRNFLFTNLRCR